MWAGAGCRILKLYSKFLPLPTNPAAVHVTCIQLLASEGFG